MHGNNVVSHVVRLVIIEPWLDTAQFVVQPVSKECKEKMDQKETKEALDVKEFRETKETKEPLVIVDSQEQQDPKDTKVPTETKEAQEPMAHEDSLVMQDPQEKMSMDLKDSREWLVQEDHLETKEPEAPTVKLETMAEMEKMVTQDQ